MEHWSVDDYKNFTDGKIRKSIPLYSAFHHELQQSDRGIIHTVVYITGFQR